MLEEKTRRLREPAAWVALSAAAVQVLLGALNLLFVRQSALAQYTFAEQAARYEYAFLGLHTTLLPVIAVLLAIHVGKRLPRARAIAIAALSIEGVAALFGLISWIAAMGATEASALMRFGDFLKGGVGLAALAVGILLSVSVLGSGTSRGTVDPFAPRTPATAAPAGPDGVETPPQAHGQQAYGQQWHGQPPQPSAPQELSVPHQPIPSQQPTAQQQAAAPQQPTNPWQAGPSQAGPSQAGPRGAPPQPGASSRQEASNEQDQRGRGAGLVYGQPPGDMPPWYGPDPGYGPPGHQLSAYDAAFRDDAAAGPGDPGLPDGWSGSARQEPPGHGDQGGRREADARRDEPSPWEPRPDDNPWWRPGGESPPPPPGRSAPPR